MLPRRPQKLPKTSQRKPPQNLPKASQGFPEAPQKLAMTYSIGNALVVGAPKASPRAPQGLPKGSPSPPRRGFMLVLFKVFATFSIERRDVDHETCNL